VLLRSIGPIIHMAGEGQIRERLAKQRLELRGQCWPVLARRLLGGDLARRLALHELALAGVQRRQRVVARLQGAHLGADAEQLADEVLQIRPKADQQLAVSLVVQRSGLRPTGEQPLGKRLIARGQPVQERLIQPGQAGVVIKNFGRQTKRKMQRSGHDRGHGERAWKMGAVL